ncbi:GTPase ObgE [Eremococcus coleocola]|uniref:GTPase Obg n=1 Tax=Eremococcus coleocola ACS-139-V-Col8 TaxID=908337 RepID=E4KM23_9LACT|nr:GTPase ObgE [Eremococcus coleocola]EFR31995.1 Obg family GTPase CgtA [Eremococcus coleocola ACS-139-V-Col8]
MSTFLDYAKVNVKAGKGGDGMVAFRREKYVPDGGPAGGDGGRGGSVIFKVDEGLRTLMDFKYNRHFKAKPGENGMSKSKYGAAAEDLVVAVPPGTIIKDANTGQFIADMLEHGQEVVVAQGGRGGRGNIRFATHKNPAPAIAENGEPGQEVDLILELKVLADVALIGYPSVGKSTLLSVISNSKPKIADYQFTTLSPNLGVVKLGYDQEFVVADIPGLIEGASQGVGLGTDFLKHIERTNVLLHVIDMAGVHGRDPFDDFVKLMGELEQYNERLLLRPMVIVANKMDQAAAEDNLLEFKAQLANYYADKEYSQPEIFQISAWQTKGLDELLKATFNIVQEADFVPLYNETATVEQYVHYQLDEEKPEFEIHRLNGDYYEITGEKIEKLFQMTNMAHDESVNRFVRQMRAMGIDQALREKGAKSGDTVDLMGFTFEFVD